MELLPLLQSQWRALAEEAQILVSLTAGLDSRVTLATSYQVRDKLTYFTYAASRTDMESPSQYDADFARKLCEDLGVRHTTVKVGSYLTSGPLSGVMKLNSRRVHSPSVAAAYREQLPLNAIHVRSNVYEIGRAFFRNAASRPLGDLNARGLAKRCVRTKGGHSTMSAAVDAFEDWLEITRFSEVTEYDPYDLYYWELRMGRWLPALVAESDIAHDTFTIVNSRRMLELLLAASDEERLSARVFDAIIWSAWPGLLTYSVNRQRRDYLP